MGVGEGKVFSTGGDSTTCGDGFSVALTVGILRGLGAGEGNLEGLGLTRGEVVAFGDEGAVKGAEFGAIFSPKILRSPVSKTPAILPIIIVAKVPTNKAFQPNSEISLLREGIKAIVPPTKIPTDAT